MDTLQQQLESVSTRLNELCLPVMARIIDNAVITIHRAKKERDGYKYQAELYDEVWHKAKALGFMNVTMALCELESLRAQLKEYQNLYLILNPSAVEIMDAESFGMALQDLIDENKAKGEMLKAAQENVGLIPMHNGNPDITGRMKAACIGEFSWKEEAPYYDEDGELHDYVATHIVPWDLCKDIYKRMASAAILDTPIPAQPSTAVAVPDSVYCSNETKLKPEVEKHLESLIALRKEMQSEDSRTQFHAWADEKGFEMSEVWSSSGEPFESEDTQLAWEIWQASRSLLSAPPPRITEQDAREIAKEFIPYWEACEMSVTVDQCFDYWTETNAFSHLLNKLNNKTVK